MKMKNKKPSKPSQKGYKAKTGNPQKLPKGQFNSTDFSKQPSKNMEPGYTDSMLK